MNWEQITNAISAFFDKPVVVTLSGIFSGALILFTIFAKTSFGRKAINKLTALYNLGARTATQTLKKVEDVEKLATEKISELEAENSQKIEELKQEYEKKVSVLVSLFNFYIDALFETLATIPNVKLQAKVQELKEKYEDKKAAITQVVGLVYQDFTSALEKSREEIRKEYDEKLEFVTNQLNQLKLFISEIKEENINGEEREQSESSADSDRIEEEIQEDQ